jgi:hypothetical protein
VDGGDALIGVRSDNMTLSKRLFESVLLGDNKIQARKAQQETQRERQRELAAARASTPPRPQLEIITGSFVKTLPVESPTPAVSQKTQPQKLAQTAPTAQTMQSEPAKVIPINRPKMETAKKTSANGSGSAKKVAMKAAAPEKAKPAKTAKSPISKPKAASKTVRGAASSKSKPAALQKKNQKPKPKAAAGKPAIKSKAAPKSKAVAGKKAVVKGKSLPKSKPKTKALQAKKPKVTAKSKKNSRRSVRAS